MSRSIRNQFRTWLDAISGMTAPVDISATPQNRTGAFVQLRRDDYEDNQTLDANDDSMIVEDYSIGCFADTAATAAANAELILTALATIDGDTLTDRDVAASNVISVSDDADRDAAGQETGLFYTLIQVRLIHSPTP